MTREEKYKAHIKGKFFRSSRNDYNRAFRAGFADALMNRPSTNPYTFSQSHSMEFYNNGYAKGLTHINNNSHATAA